MIVYLHNLQSPINIGMILRSAEIFGANVWIYDGFDVLSSDPATMTVSDFACGAAERTPMKILNQPIALPLSECRTVATTIAPDAKPVHDFTWGTNDVVCVGNEYDGLPKDIISSSDLKLTIPLPQKHLPKPKSISPIDPTRPAGPTNDGQPSLNTAVAASIILFEWYNRSHSDRN